MSVRAQTSAALPRYFSSKVLHAKRFHLPLVPINKNGFHVLGGGCEHCRPDYVIARPGFPYTILEYVAGGQGQLVINNHNHLLGPGSMFTYGRGIRHRIITDPDHPLVKYFLVLAGTAVTRMLNRHELPLGAVVRVGRMERIRELFDELIAFGLRDRADRQECCTLATCYLLKVAREYHLRDHASTARAYATYERCRHYIEENALRLNGLEQVAAACHVDKAYLCRLFQRFGRERPFQYLQHVRMNHAMMLMQTTDRLVKDIAAELGFTDPANFTRTFRRWFGVAPQAVRR